MMHLCSMKARRRPRGFRDCPSEVEPSPHGGHGTAAERDGGARWIEACLGPQVASVWPRDVPRGPTRGIQGRQLVDWSISWLWSCGGGGQATVGHPEG